MVERLNNSPHLEKIHYFMSKADAVEKEHDRQRVLIQVRRALVREVVGTKVLLDPREKG